jgi:hypothetical protein
LRIRIFFFISEIYAICRPLNKDCLEKVENTARATVECTEPQSFIVYNNIFSADNPLVAMYNKVLGLEKEPGRRCRHIPMK